MMKRIILITILLSLSVLAKTLEVGTGKAFLRIEDALVKAKSGDIINVYPLKNNQPYDKVAIYMRLSNITIRGIGKSPVKLSGKGFDYSGRGSVPRAIIQFNKGTDNCVVENFELFEAHNKSHNGAAFRISYANNIRISKCIIRNNDMGIMSNGDGSTNFGQNQIIEHCHIHSNGNFQDPGYNHNLYLGGASVTMRFCEVNNSLTGHNYKSRTHFNLIEYCYIHDSANREFDLVDAKETTHEKSHSVLLGNLIVKGDKIKGNRGVLHFGQDGGKAHNGDLYLIHNTILTPYISPVIYIDHAQSGLKAYGNIFHDSFSNQKNMKLIELKKGALEKSIIGSQNYFSKGFKDIPSFQKSQMGNSGIFNNPDKLDYRLNKTLTGPTLKRSSIPIGPGMTKSTTFYQYQHPLGKKKRPKQSKLSIGAFD